MPEFLRPSESAAIQSDLRIRLEGTIELLEDALPLMDSVHDLLSRDEPSRDDVATLQECINQLPRLAQALDRAQQHETAGELTRALRARLESARLVANERLVQRGTAEQPSLRAALVETAKQLRQQGTAPGPGETQLLAASSPPVVFALLIALGAGALTWTGLGAPWHLLAGALALFLALRWLTPRPWVLLPDRIFFPKHGAELARECTPAELEGARIDGSRVVARLGREEVELHCESPKRLLSLLTLLGGPSLSGLLSRPRRSVVLQAEGGEPSEGGFALVSAEGVLFVPTLTASSAVRCLSGQPLPVPLELEELLQLLAHVPQEKWPSVCAQLEANAGAVWLRPGELTVEPSANAHLGRTLVEGERKVHLAFPAPRAGDDRQLRAEEVLGRLKG